MAQISKWTEIPTTLPVGKTFHGLSTAGVTRANLLFRKIDNFVERWPQLSLVKNVDIGTDLTVKLGLEYDEFAAGAENDANWTYNDDGETNLVIDSIVRSVGNKEVTITFAAEVLWPQLELGGVQIDDVDPAFTVELSRDTFTSEAACENTGNWTLAVGDTGLTVATITYVDPTHCTIETTGTCAAGVFTAKVKAAALDGSLDSGVASYDTEEETSACTNVDHKAGFVRFKAKAEALDGSLATGDMGFIASETDPGGESVQVAPSILVTAGIDTADEDPVLKIVLNNYTFVSAAMCEYLPNWNIDAQDVGLSVSRIEYVSQREAWIHFEGTAAPGYVGIITEPGLMFADEHAVVGQSIFVDEAEWGGTYEQSAIAGDLYVYQVGADDFSYFLDSITVASDEETANVALNLVDSSGFNPKMPSSFWYDLGDAEASTCKLYGQLILD